MRRGPLAALTLVLASGLAVAAAAPARPSVSTKQVSVTRRGGDPFRDSDQSSISADGRYVAFASWAADLVPGDGNDTYDIFVRDLVAGVTVRASVDAGGGDANSSSTRPSISADGRYVAFWSYPSDLVAGDGNDAPDVFVRDLVSGTTVRVSVDTEDGDADGSSFGPSISADGRSVAFSSEAPDLVPEDGNRIQDVFVRDLVAGTTVRASVDTGGDDADAISSNPSISADGRHVAFESPATDLVVGDRNGHPDVYVRDLVAGTTVRASADVGGGDPAGGSFQASISSGGRYMAYHSYAADLVHGDGNGEYDVFVRDLVAGTTIRASVDTLGGDPNGSSYYPSISAHGRYVAFESGAGNLLPGRGDRGLDVFVARFP